MKYKNKSKCCDFFKRLKKDFIEILHSPKDLIILGIPAIFMILTFIPVPYYITVGGGVIDVSDRITILDEDSDEGSLNLAYVKELKGNVLTYLMSLVVPNYEATKISDVVLDEESKEDYAYREKLELKISHNNAIKVAYNALGYDLEVKNTILHVAYLDPVSKTELKVGDIILKIEGKQVRNREDLDSLIKEFYYKDEISLTVLRDSEEMVVSSKLVEIDNEKKMGIYIILEHEYETLSDIEFKFKDNESGPSGGLMMSLSIYNKLVDDDITKGKMIVGTGTIDEEGNVGEIGGVTYKIMGAVKGGADVFLVPTNNYLEAINFVNKKGYDIKLIKVDTFDEALKELKMLN